MRIEAIKSIVGYYIDLGRDVTEEEMDKLDDLFYEGLIDKITYAANEQSKLFIDVPEGLDKEDMKRLMECFDDDNL